MVPFDVKRFDVFAIERNEAIFRFVESLDQADDARLAAAAGPAKGHDPPGLDIGLQGDTFENLDFWLARVAELHVVEFENAACILHGLLAIDVDNRCSSHDFNNLIASAKNIHERRNGKANNHELEDHTEDIQHECCNFTNLDEFVLEQVLG